MIIEIGSCQLASTTSIAYSSISKYLKPKHAATLLSTTATSQTSSPIIIGAEEVNLTQSYIQTMSDEELEDLLMKIDEKIENIDPNEKQNNNIKKLKKVNNNFKNNC